MSNRPRTDQDPQSARRPKRRAPALRWAEPEQAANNTHSTPRGSQEPAERPRKSFITQYYFWGTLALLAAGLAAGSLIWQIRQSLQQPSASEAALPGDPLSPLDEAVRTALLEPTPELAAKLKRSFLGKPQSLCTELHDLGLKNPGWTKAPFHRDRWQCASILVPLTTPSVDYGSTTLFFLLRGPAEDKIDYLRLKLVVDDPRQKQIGLEAVWLVIDGLAGRYGWTVPDRFRSAVSGFDHLETDHRGVRLSVAPEDPSLTGDPRAGQRLNIILNFGEPDLIRPAERFELAPPLEQDWNPKDPSDPEEE